MTQKVVLHVGGLNTFMPPFVKLVNEEFSGKNHQFWLYGQKSNRNFIERLDNVFVARGTIAKQVCAHLKLLLMLHRARKVVLHGIFNPRVVLLLTLCPWLLKKCYWIILGGDLYLYQSPKRHLKDKVKEGQRAFVIERMGHLVTYIPGDLELARKWYSARGEHHECLMYLSNVVDPNSLIGERKKNDEHSGLKILVGNSADPSNNHIEALEKLLPYKDQDVKIFVPLSYGDQENAKNIVERGKELFGEKFIPLVSFIPPEQYLVFLNGIDIAIFNHKRQQAMGNTITLLGLGKTVYIRNDVSQWEFLTGIGLRLKPVSSFSLRLIPQVDVSNNVQMVRSHFSKERLVDQLSSILRS